MKGKMVDPILISPYFLDFILPFVLVFTLIFAILQRTQILGEGKKQIDSIVALVIGLILIASPARDIVVLLMPFLAVFAVILLVFLLLYGFIVGRTGGDILDKGWKYVWGGLLAISLVTVLLFVTGLWDFVYDYFFNQEGSAQVWINGLLILVIVGALIAVLRGGGGGSGKSE